MCALPFALLQYMGSSLLYLSLVKRLEWRRAVGCLASYCIIDSQTSMGDTSSVGYWAVRSVVREGHKELGAATMANNEDSDVKMIEDKTDVSLKQAKRVL